MNDLEIAGVQSRRAWGSNGESMGEHETVDILAAGRWKIQAKRKKAIAKALIPTEHVDAVVTRADAKPGKRKPDALVIMRLDDWADMVRRDVEARRQLGETEQPVALACVRNAELAKGAKRKPCRNTFESESSPT